MKKLGEILIERGLITGAQLDMALRNQLMLGGHLGTCLLELGFLEEDVLGRTLAEVNGVPYASPEIIARIRGTVIRSLPPKVVEECQAIPLERNGQRLFVAMVNPRDLGARDALAFASGCRIVPWVAPEVRIFEGMEKLYGIPRRLRYIAINRARSPLEIASGRGATTTAVSGSGAAGEQSQEANENPIWGDDPHLGDQRSWREIANELFPEDASHGGDSAATLPVPADLAERAVRTVRADVTTPLERAAERLCGANSPDDVARAVLDEAARALPRVALFSVKGDELRFWGARGMNEDAAIRGAEPFPVSSQGIFGHLGGDEHYCGPLQRAPECLAFYAWLGIEAPAGILLVPVHLNDRLVALIYGDAGRSGTIEVRVGDLVRLSRMLAYALTSIIYKNKIRGIGAMAKEVHA